MSRITMESLDPTPPAPKTFGRYHSEEAARKGGEWRFWNSTYHTLACDLGWACYEGPLPPNATGKTYEPVTIMEPVVQFGESRLIKVGDTEVRFVGEKAHDLAHTFTNLLFELNMEYEDSTY